jgi:hypothetical protein
MIHDGWATKDDGRKVAHLFRARMLCIQWIARYSLCGRIEEDEAPPAPAGDGRPICQQCARRWR